MPDERRYIYTPGPFVKADDAFLKREFENIARGLNGGHDALAISVGNNADGIADNANSIANINRDLTVRSRRNLFINGDFWLWNRATSHSANGLGSDDRWAIWSVGSTFTNSRQVLAPGTLPGNPQYYCKVVVNSVVGANNYCLKVQSIEDVRTAAGKTATVSFYAKANIARSLFLEAVQYFGASGSASTYTKIGKAALTTGWQKFAFTFNVPSISGKVIGTSGNDSLQINFCFDAGSSFNSRTDNLGHQSGTFDLALMQLEIGDTATDFEWTPQQERVANCARYYQRLNYNGLNRINSGYYGGAILFAVVWPVQFRATPATQYAVEINDVITATDVYWSDNKVTVMGYSGAPAQKWCDLAYVNGDAEL